MPVSYDFKDPIFKKDKRYRRLAREHLSISQIKSDRIKWRVVETATRLDIPIRYEVHYLVKSIIGIDDNEAPVYGDKHTIEISFPARFPLETFVAKTTSNVWHPNIKWDGQPKGRICVNNKSFGRGYDIYWLILRIGEIIQYKNYLAENIPPYPEDVTVAEWVRRYAEPQGILKQGEKPVDNSNLLEYTPKKQGPKIVVKKVNKKSSIQFKNIKKKKKDDNE